MTATARDIQDLPKDFTWAELAEDTRPVDDDTAPILIEDVACARRSNTTHEAELASCLATLHAPEASSRIEARLEHIRRNAAAPLSATTLHAARGQCNEALVLRRGAISANAIIPGSASGWGDGIHLGGGYVLRRWSGRGQDTEGLGSTVLNFHLARTAPESAPVGSHNADLPGEVRFDPRPGKVLKHETAHALFVGEDRQVRVAMSALRVVGHRGQHVYVTTAIRGVSGATLFCFNESWQFVGLGTGHVSSEHLDTRGEKAFAILRPTAIWDDLVARADLGCGRSADALNAMARPQLSTPSRAPDQSQKTPEFGYR
ncbi:MAG: hypothetical protein AAGF78_08405 [Pseudomonadota bacterium]